MGVARFCVRTGTNAVLSKYSFDCSLFDDPQVKTIQREWPRGLINRQSLGALDEKHTNDRQKITFRTVLGGCSSPLLGVSRTCLPSPPPQSRGLMSKTLSWVEQ